MAVSFLLSNREFQYKSDRKSMLYNNQKVNKKHSKNKLQYIWIWCIKFCIHS